MSRLSLILVGSMITFENARFRSATARWVLGVSVALSLSVACGRSSSRSRNHSPDGEGGTTVWTGGTSAGGAAGASTPDAGEPGSDRGGQAGETEGGAGAGVSGEPGLGGGSSVGGASAGAAGGPTAGTSAGGSSGSGGAGGTAGMPVLPLPDGCEARGRTEDEESCSIGVFCEGVPNLANCRRLSSDDWQCSCELANNDRTYEIAGAPGLKACAVAAGLCFEDELALGSEVCTESGESNDDACELDLTCGKPIDVGFAPGVTASLMDYGHGACWRTGTAQPFECTCEHGGVTRDFGILTEDGSLACRPLIEFCRQDIEPTFDEPTVCIERDPSSSAESCDLHSTCATPMKLTDDVSLAELEPHYANCVATSSGSRCYCSTRTETFGFDIEESPSPTTCASSIANCADDVSISPLGDASCHATSQHAGTDFCEADLDCLQPASVDERAIVARGRLLVHCAQSAADQSWWCSCASNQDSTIFEFGETEASAWDVCSGAPARCLERMPVFLGPYGEFMPPPYPLSEP
jgi:hypothetical protein